MLKAFNCLQRFAYMCSTQERNFKLTTNAYWRIAYIRCYKL